MIKNIAIKDFISIIPMPAVVIDFRGFIRFSNYLYNFSPNNFATV